MIFRPLVLATLCSLAISSLPYPAEADIPDSTIYGPPPLTEGYRRALAIDPDNLNLRYRYGMALLETGNHRDAAVELGKAYPAFVHCAEASYLLGLVHTRSGDVDRALFCLEQAENLGATQQQELLPLADAYYSLAQPLLEADRMEEAAALFAKALMLAPERKEIHRLLGEVYADSGLHDKALAEFASTLEAYPADAATAELVYTLNFKEALRLLEQNDFAAAHEALESALAANPGSPLAIYYLGYLEYSQGHYEQAAARLSAIYETSPADIRHGAGTVLYNSAIALLEQGKLRAALAALSPLTAQDSTPAKTLYLAGNIHLSLQEFAVALNCFKRVLAQEPSHRGATMNIVAARAGAVGELLGEARARLRRGELRKATKKLEALLTIRPGHAEALADLERCRTEMERRSGEHFARAEELLHRNEKVVALAEINAGLDLSPASSYGRLLKEEVMQGLEEKILTLLAEGDRLHADNRLSEADSHYAGVLELDPDNERAQQARKQISLSLRLQGAELAQQGTREMEEGDLDAACEAYQRALQLDPQQREATRGLVRSEALRATMLAEKLQWARRAVGAGQWREAAGYFTEALSLRDTAEIHRELAAAENKLTNRLFALLDAAWRALERNEYHRSRYYFLEARALAPDSPGIQIGLDELKARAAATTAHQLAAAQRNAGDGMNHGLAAYRRVLEIDPGNEKALIGVKSALAKLNGDLAGQVAAGRNAAKNGEYEEAEEILRHVLGRDPWHAEARRDLERLERTIPAADPAPPPTVFLHPAAEEDSSGESADASSLDTVKHRPVQAP